MATELLKNPTVILAMHKNKFNRMPTTLDRAAYAFFTFGLETSFLFLINSFTNTRVVVKYTKPAHCAAAQKTHASAKSARSAAADKFRPEPQVEYDVAHAD